MARRRVRRYDAVQGEETVVEDRMRERVDSFVKPPTSSSPSLPYSSLDALALNARRPSTEWLNMGRWRGGAGGGGQGHDTPSTLSPPFPVACRELALSLYDAVEIQSGLRVLDVGHGSGDSLLLLKERHRPEVLHGVTALAHEARRARERMAEGHEETNDASSPSWQVHRDDAVRYLEREGAGPYDVVLALDCAYHFDTRRRFFQAAAAALTPGGRLGLVDLVSSYPYPREPSSSPWFTPSPLLPAPKRPPSWLARGRHALLIKLAGVPKANIVSLADYRADLLDAGFEPSTLAIQDISHDVFPGFARFLAGYGRRGDEARWRPGGWTTKAALRLFGRTVAAWGRGGDEGRMRCVMVVATRATRERSDRGASGY